MARYSSPYSSPSTPRGIHLHASVDTSKISIHHSRVLSVAGTQPRPSAKLTVFISLPHRMLILRAIISSITQSLSTSWILMASLWRRLVKASLRGKWRRRLDRQLESGNNSVAKKYNSLLLTFYDMLWFTPHLNALILNNFG